MQINIDKVLAFDFDTQFKKYLNVLFFIFYEIMIYNNVNNVCNRLYSY